MATVELLLPIAIAVEPVRVIPALPVINPSAVIAPIPVMIPVASISQSLLLIATVAELLPRVVTPVEARVVNDPDDPEIAAPDIAPADVITIEGEFKKFL
jgi:hypothetical protein